MILYIIGGTALLAGIAFLLHWLYSEVWCLSDFDFGESYWATGLVSVLLGLCAAGFVYWDPAKSVIIAAIILAIYCGFIYKFRVGGFFFLLGLCAAGFFYLGWQLDFTLILGATIVLTFIACAIHGAIIYSSDFLDLFASGGWITMLVCIAIGASVAGYIYWNPVITLIIVATILVTVIISFIHILADNFGFYNLDFDDGGWITILFGVLLGLCAVGFIYWNPVVSIVIASSLTIAYLFTVYGYAGIFILLSSLCVIGCIFWNWPLTLSIVIGATSIATLIACTIHNLIICGDDFKEFFTEYYGWVTVIIGVVIGITVIGCIYWSIIWSIVIGVVLIAGLLIGLYFKFNYQDTYINSMPNYTLNQNQTPDNPSKQTLNANDTNTPQNPTEPTVNTNTPQNPTEPTVNTNTPQNPTTVNTVTDIAISDNVIVVAKNSDTTETVANLVMNNTNKNKEAVAELLVNVTDTDK